MGSNPNHEPQILKSRSGKVLRIELNRSEAINSLNLLMVSSLWRILKDAETDNEIAIVVLSGRGEKGFCAGGDVKAVCQNTTEILHYAEEFFQFEYLVDAMMANYKKPIVCFGHGITMGGGLGLFMGSSHRVAFTNSVFAMPEPAIGFFPDVGATYFLQKTWKPEIALFLALSGSTFDCNDALFLNCATHIVNPENFMRLIQSIESASWSPISHENHHLVSQLITDFHQEGSSSLAQQHADFVKLFSCRNLKDYVKNWKELAAQNSILKNGLDRFLLSSPLSQVLTWQLLKNDWSRTEVAIRDWDIAIQMCKDSDFHEGVRALLIDKDKNPKWKHRTFEEVKEDEINRLLSPVPGNPLLNYFSATM